MISIIICSTQQELSPSLLKNIEDSIGSEYEIIPIDNSKGVYSIFQAYNIGVSNAKGDILCFMHEDIIIHTGNWGHIVENLMLTDNIGMLGVAGCNAVFSKGDWRFSGLDDSTAVVQGTFTLEKNSRYYRTYIPNFTRKIPLCKVAVLDGVWFCIPKSLFNIIRFDEESYDGFHLYDSDISMQINSIGKDVCLTHDILLEHFSQGLFSCDFNDALAVFHNKWKESLPFITHIHLTENEKAFYEHQSVTNLENRIKTDTIVRSIRNKQKGEGTTSSSQLTIEELKIQNKSLYSYFLNYIETKNDNCSHLQPSLTRYRGKEIQKHDNVIIENTLLKDLCKINFDNSHNARLTTDSQYLFHIMHLIEELEYLKFDKVKKESYISKMESDIHDMEETIRNTIQTKDMHIEDLKSYISEQEKTTRNYKKGKKKYKQFFLITMILFLISLISFVSFIFVA